MNWKKINKEKICCCWVILGYWETDYKNMAWQIGRKMGGKLEFWGDTNGGPYAGDSIWPFDPEQATHYFEIEIPEEEDLPK